MFLQGVGNSCVLTDIDLQDLDVTQGFFRPLNSVRQKKDGVDSKLSIPFYFFNYFHAETYFRYYSCVFNQNLYGDFCTNSSHFGGEYFVIYFEILNVMMK